MTPHEFLHPDDLKWVAVRVLELEPGAELAPMETRCLSKDGSWKWFEWIARRDDDSGLIFGVARDVTDLRAQREALRADELQLQAIVDNSGSAIFVKDRLSRYVLVNDAFLHPIGKTADEVIGKTAAEIWPEAADTLDRDRDTRLLEQGDVETSDDQVELADGAHTFMTVRFPLRDSADHIVGFAGITTDITERTRIEEAFGERQRLLDTIVRASPDIVTIIDRSGRVTDISEASKTILGFDLENPVHEEVAALVHPDDVPGIIDQYAKLLTLQETRLDISYRVKHHDGHWVTLDSRGQAIIGDDGASAGVVVISRDVTADLEFEEQLRAAAGVAENASEAKSDFLSRMSHELRTPLNSVLGFAQLLEMDGLPPQQDEAVGHILRAGRHLLNLIDEVLDIARIESGRLDLAVEPVALASVLHDAVNLAGPLAEERHVEIALDLSLCPYNAHVEADRQRLLQVMLNLLSNGIKYNVTGGRVQVSASLRDGERTAIAVTDTGPGIAPEDIGRVFEPFDRLGAELTGIEGTGVGLTLSKYLVERMGGSIDLQSQVEVGCTFTVDLPSAVAPASLEDDGDTVVDPSGYKGTIRILHIEDNLANLELVEQVLTRRQPVELLAAMYGCLGLDLARSHRPDLILLDLHLPDMSGVDVLDELRRDPVTRDTPVVIVSADATATQIRRLHGKGATAYLTKPIDIHELIPRGGAGVVFHQGGIMTSPAATVSHEGRRYLRQFLDISTHILCITDFTDTVLWCSTAFEQTLGYEPGELDGANMREQVYRDDVPAQVGAATMLRLGNDVTGLVTRLRCKDGTWRTLEWNAHPDVSRRRVHHVGRDVTALRALEEERRDNAARLRAILEHSPSAIFVKGMNGRYLVVNDEWSRLTGCAAEDAVGATVSDAWPSKASDIGAFERELIANGNSLVTEEKMPTAAGERDFMVGRFLLRDDEGNSYAIGGIATDITERKKAEAALAERDRVLQTVLKASPDIITLMDRHGRIHQVSEAERTILGWHHEDNSAPDIFTKVHPDDLDEVGAAFVRMVTGGVQTIHLRYRVHHADGRWVSVDSRGQAVPDERGHFSGAVVVSRDITAALEHEMRLQAARDAAEKASMAKSDFLSRMSHELRTPLNSILGFSQLLQLDELSVIQADGVDHILRAGRHLLDLIDEVLDIARIESGYLELALEPVAVAEVVGEAVSLTRPMAERAEVVVRVSIDARNAVAVRADKQRLLQVLLNLLSNAVKYNRPGGHIDINCEAIGRDQMRLAVADTGRGIRPDDMARVFEPFDRLGAEQSGVEGSGVGLAVSKQLVDRMGGQLTLESVPGVGSTFFVDLPAASLDWADVYRGPKALPPTSSTNLGHFRVLLIEDGLTNLDLVERVLSRRPRVEVLAAMQGGLGLDLAREHLPDLVLLDLDLPDMDGMTVLDRLQTDDATASVSVAVISADLAAPQVRSLLSRGVVGHLTKPLDVRGLLSLIDVVRASRGV